MKYLRKFNTRVEYENFILTTSPCFPNLCLINEEKHVEYNVISPLYDYPLCVEAIEDITVSFGNTYEYSKDNNTWESGDSSTIISAIAGEKVYFKSSGLSANSSSGIGKFTISNGKCNIGGNIMSMIYGDDFLDKMNIDTRYQFLGLFKSCVGIVNAINLFLPATTLAISCYAGMFSGCTSLTSVPALPATTLAPNCYENMFYGCTSLTVAPTLPATTLAEYCYNEMFRGCTSLTVVPALTATTLAYCCYEYMFCGCTSLTVAPTLPATTLAVYCYGKMFSGCTSLTTAPELPATTLAGNCYYEMFYGCTSLTTAPELPATTLAENCYYGMFGGCNSLTTAPELPATTLANSCYSGMFERCTSLTTATELPSTTLKKYCYNEMFRGCNSLTTAPELPATTLAPNCYNCMFYGCTSLTVSPILPSTTLVSNCYSYMFYDCNILKGIVCMCITPPTSTYALNMLSGVSSTGTFVKNFEAEWDSSVGIIPNGWSLVDNSSMNLSITAPDVRGYETSTTITYVLSTNVTDESGNTSLFVIKTGTAISETFPQNTSYTDTVEHEISFTYMGMTATTTITQGVCVNYEVVLNDNWQMSTEISNPDSTTYDGVYESFSNKGKDSTAAIMYIDIVGYDTFGLYIRSNAESSYDYVMVSQLDKNINNDTSYSDATLVKAHTCENQQSGTAISNYTYVEFTGIDRNDHRITIVYRKDKNTSSGTDCGYVLIPKNQ